MTFCDHIENLRHSL